MSQIAPESKQFWNLLDALDRIEDEIQWPEVDRSFAPVNALAALAYPTGLLGPPVDKSKLPEATVKRVNDLLASDEAAKWIQSQPNFQRFWESFDRLSKNKKSKFSDSVAGVRIWRALIFGLHKWTLHVSSSTIPEVPGAEDWRRALDALKALDALQDKDVSLWKAIKSHDHKRAATYKWLDELRDAITKASKDGPRPYKDPDLVSRVAVKTFAHWCWIQFGDAPTSLAVQFGRMINYTSERIERSYMPAWRASFRADSIV